MRWCTHSLAGSQLSMRRATLAPTFIFLERHQSCVKCYALSREHSYFGTLMGGFFRKSIFLKLLVATSPILKRAFCVWERSFCTRQDESNGVLIVWIGSLRAEINFSGTRVHRRFLPLGCHCGIPHSVHRCQHTWGYLFRQYHFWHVPGPSQGISF